MDSVLKLLNPGDEVIATDDLYGGSYRIMTKVFGKYGINFQFAGISNIKTLADLITPKTKMIWVETPTNPCLLYTSDAADERSSVDLGGRRINKKKRKKKKRGKRKSR